jgi:transposase InsO family protein
VEEVTPLPGQAASALPVQENDVECPGSKCEYAAGVTALVQECRRLEAERGQCLHACLDLSPESAAQPRRGDRTRQHARQQLQQTLRQEAVTCYQQLQDQGATLDEVAQRLGLRPRTLRYWEHLSRPASCALLLGRPLVRSPRPERQAVLDYFKLVGPGVGLPTLQEKFPALARAELTDLLGRYRAVCRVRYGSSLHVLHWQVPGRVWAMDFAALTWHGLPGTLPPVAGKYPYLLAVRDLASGYQLAWVPVSAASAAETQTVLARLFREHGAPLGLKSDNGPPFRADDMKKFLAEEAVFPLFSPPACPGYNGAIEAAIGSLKTRTQRHAVAHGHGGLWTEDDLVAACAEANAGHPRRLNGRTPSWVWDERSSLADVERVCFTLTVERHRFLVRSELGIAQEELLDHWQQSGVDRKALERALVEHDHLLFTRRRLPLTIKPGKVTKVV